MRLLVSHGADIHEIDDSGRKPIDRIYRLPQAQFLIEFGADVTEQRRDKYCETLLHRISYQAEDEEDLELLEYLLDAGVDVDLQTAQPNLAQELIDYKRICFFLGIEYDPSRARTAGRTPLHSAAKGGAEQAVKLLLKYGADPNIRNANGQLAMDIAELAGHHQIAQLLMQAMSE